MENLETKFALALKEIERLNHENTSIEAKAC